MNWREIQKDETELLKEANGFERSFPVFFRDAANAWSATEGDALAFYARCERLFGIFDTEGGLVALVYTEAIMQDAVEVHLDLRRGTDPKDIIPSIAEITQAHFENGLQLCMAWVLKRNRGIQKMLQALGFRFSGLELKTGSSHGKTLKWFQMIVTPEVA